MAIIRAEPADVDVDDANGYVSGGGEFGEPTNSWPLVETWSSA